MPPEQDPSGGGWLSEEKQHRTTRPDKMIAESVRLQVFLPYGHMPIAGPP